LLLHVLPVLLALQARPFHLVPVGDSTGNERSPRTPLSPPIPLYAPGPVYPVPRTSMMDARRYHSMFSRRRVAPPTPPYPSPPPSDEEPSEGTIDPAAELEGDLDEPYHEDIVYPAGHEAYHSNTSYGSERESVSASS
ncbi:hypothetical protein PIB30_113487, partial [Stylosanthes scabra]|nr:hypothetical protein [Stylosanthes scabra]